jgi:hypothetical protein
MWGLYLNGILVGKYDLYVMAVHNAMDGYINDGIKHEVRLIDNE